MDFFSSSLILCNFMNYVSYYLNKVIKYSLDFSQSLLLYHIEVGRCHNWNLCLWALLSGKPIIFDVFKKFASFYGR